MLRRATKTPWKRRLAKKLKAMEILDQVCLSDISEEIWRAAIDALAAAGWSLRKGGGLDFSWAVLDRDGMRIDMEYHIWVEGEMAFGHSPHIRNRSRSSRSTDWRPEARIGRVNSRARDTGAKVHLLANRRSILALTPHSVARRPGEPCGRACSIHGPNDEPSHTPRCR